MDHDTARRPLTFVRWRQQGRRDRTCRKWHALHHERHGLSTTHCGLTKFTRDISETRPGTANDGGLCRTCRTLSSTE